MRAAIFVLSAVVLAHEVCLFRVLAIAWWGHAASLVVAVALLAFGAAGTAVAFLGRLRRPATVAVAGALYAVLLPVSLRLAEGVAFHPLEVGWDPREWWSLLALQALFCLPLFFAALAIAVALALHARRPGAIYGMNLLGSGLGALAAAPLLLLGPPENVLTGLAVAAALGAALVPGRIPKVAGALAAVLALLLGGHGLPMSPFKDLPATPGGRVLETRWGPQGRVDLVETPHLHFAPGLSLHASSTPPLQRGLFLDGHLVAAKDLGPSSYLDETTGALPFVLVSPQDVLLLGVGPQLGRATVVVDANQDLLALADVQGVAAPPRAWLETTGATFDAVLLHVGDGPSAEVTPLLTVEGLRAALARVRPDGAFAVSTNLTSPPRPGMRLLETARAVTPNLVAIRSSHRLCVVLRHRASTVREIEAVRAFCERDGFDLVLPRANRPAHPLHEAASLLDPPGDHPYDVRPATDARPFFHAFFRWARLGDLFDRERIPYVEWPYVALIVAFVQVVVLSLLLLLVPLLLRRVARAPAPLFLALGFAFMLLEMAWLARATVHLGSPVIAASAVLGGFLVGSGVGSLLSERLGRPLQAAALLAAVLPAAGYVLLPDGALAVGLLAALVALPMGIPFPSALARLPDASVPWALAVNGCASVGAAALSPLLATTVSIDATLALGAALYLLVALRGGRGAARATSPSRRTARA